MRKVLFAWIGMTDLKAAAGEVASGPIDQAAQKRGHDEVILLSDHAKTENARYAAWLTERCGCEARVRPCKLASPTHFATIYESTHRVVREHLDANPGIAPEFHLSPGTPAMAAIWIILSKTEFPSATLIESSKERGVSEVTLPFDLYALYTPEALARQDTTLVEQAQAMPPEAPAFADILHKSPVMKRLIARARLVAPRDIPVLILGESGTGKEMLARAIHQDSPRRDNPFVAVNCGAIPESLRESALFGHVKGAFTGAVASHKGYIEQADGGTLFLDEVGELPLATQVALLRVLNDKSVTPLGGTKPAKLDFRLVCATNRDLFREVALQRFREDLFYRIAVAVLKTPPLRDRTGDLPLITDALLDRYNRDHGTHKILSPSTRHLIQRHPWPGNVRELGNTLIRAAVFSPGPTITPDDIREAILPVVSEVEDAILGKPLDPAINLDEILTSVARHYLSRAMEETHGNKTRAAAMLGFKSYQTLTGWLTKYGVEDSG